MLNTLYGFLLDSLPFAGETCETFLDMLSYFSPEYNVPCILALFPQIDHELTKERSILSVISESHTRAKRRKCPIVSLLN